MQKQVYFLSQNLTLLLIIVISLLFALIGILYSRKHQGLSNYLTAGRNVGVLSLTTSLVASALGAWILFGPASAATWGGIGSVIGYSLGTTFAPNWMDWPMLYTGNPVILQPGMVFFMHMILMDSENELAMNLGETYLITPSENERLGKKKLDLVIG